MVSHWVIKGGKREVVGGLSLWRRLSSQVTAMCIEVPFPGMWTNIIHWWEIEDIFFFSVLPHGPCLSVCFPLLFPLIKLSISKPMSFFYTGMGWGQVRPSVVSLRQGCFTAEPSPQVLGPPWARVGLSWSLSTPLGSPPWSLWDRVTLAVWLRAQGRGLWIGGPCSGPGSKPGGK